MSAATAVVPLTARVPIPDEDTLVAILASAAHAAIGREVRVVAYRGPEEYAEFQVWVQLGKIQHVQSHGMR